MYKLFYAIVTIVWLLDIFNFPGFEMLDTTYPINFWMWLFIWICLPSCSERKIEITKNK